MDHDYVDGEFLPVLDQADAPPIDISERYSLLKLDFERHIERLTTKYETERQGRQLAEAELEKALVGLEYMGLILNPKLFGYLWSVGGDFIEVTFHT